MGLFSTGIIWLVVLVLTTLSDSISVYIVSSPRQREKNQKYNSAYTKCPCPIIQTSSSPFLNFQCYPFNPLNERIEYFIEMDHLYAI